VLHYDVDTHVLIDARCNGLGSLRPPLMPESPGPQHPWGGPGLPRPSGRSMS
jgi:hypothetical protein